MAVQSVFVASWLWSDPVEQELLCIVSEPHFLLFALSCYWEKHTLIGGFFVCDWIGKEELLWSSVLFRHIELVITLITLWSHISHTALLFVRSCSLSLQMALINWWQQLQPLFRQLCFVSHKWFIAELIAELGNFSPMMWWVVPVRFSAFESCEVWGLAEVLHPPEPGLLCITSIILVGERV